MHLCFATGFIDEWFGKCVGRNYGSACNVRRNCWQCWSPLVSSDLWMSLKNILMTKTQIYILLNFAIILKSCCSVPSSEPEDVVFQFELKPVSLFLFFYTVLTLFLFFFLSLLPFLGKVCWIPSFMSVCVCVWVCFLSPTLQLTSV